MDREEREEPREDMDSEERMSNRDFKIVTDYLVRDVFHVFRPPNSVLKHPFMDPAAAYAGDLWDWDSYFTAKGLSALCDRLDFCGNDPERAEELRRRTAECARGSVLNFFEHIDSTGFVPIVLLENGPFVTFFQDELHAGRPVNQHKPVFCQSVLQAAGLTGAFDWIAPHFEKLERYFSFYRENQFHAPTGLYVFRNDVMIGADNNPCVFGRPDDSCADLLLNCLLLLEFEAMGKICAELAPERERFYRGEYESLKAAVLEHCFDEYYQYFFSVDVQVKVMPSPYFHHNMDAFWRTIPLKIRTWMGFLPLYAGIVPPEQAASVVKRHFSDDRLFCPFGIRTLASDERMYDLSATSNPSNWLGAVWGVANYVVFRALDRYGFEAEAREMAEHTVSLFARDVEATGTMSESYRPDTGVPVMNGGFLSWNILVAEMMTWLERRRP